MTIDRKIELDELRLVLLCAADLDGGLNPSERFALGALALGLGQREAAQLHGNLTYGGIWMAQQSGLRKMRERLCAMGFTCSADLLSGERVGG